MYSSLNLPYERRFPQLVMNNAPYRIRNMWVCLCVLAVVFDGVVWEGESYDILLISGIICMVIGRRVLNTWFPYILPNIIGLNRVKIDFGLLFRSISIFNQKNTFPDNTFCHFGPVNSVDHLFSKGRCERNPEGVHLMVFPFYYPFVCEKWGFKNPNV